MLISVFIAATRNAPEPQAGIEQAQARQHVVQQAPAERGVEVHQQVAEGLDTRGLEPGDGCASASSGVLTASRISRWIVRSQRYSVISVRV